jgi:hexosaminidase
MHIEDGPRFAWRGLMLDVARHYMPPDFIKQMLDWMALHKLNTFHWHLTDDQGWRLEIKKYPRLTEVGAWRVPADAGPASDLDPATGKPRLYGGYYTQDEVRDIVRYAAERFITVVPEIEMPGHAQAAIAAYPQLGTEGPPPAVSSDWGVHTYLYNVDESTFSFLEDVLTEVMTLFPGQHIHVGGDEAVKDRWRASPRVQQRMRELGIADETALQSYFTHRMERFLSAQGRKLIGWDEILEGGGLPRAATVMSWRGTDGAVEATSAGHDVVMAPAPDLYLDYLQSDSPNEPPGRPRYITLADMYKFNVLPGAIAGNASRYVIGAQLNAWTEHMRTPERVQHAVFPRLSAFAEDVWSVPDRRDWSDFLRRLPAQFARYEKLGIHAADSAYEVRFAAFAAGTRSTARLELSNQIKSGDIRYTLDGKAPTPKSPSYSGPLTLPVPTTVTAATFIGGQRMSGTQTRTFDRAALLRRNDEELKSCSNKLVLRLEDDAPHDGERAVFNVDILDPCWILEKADLARITGIAASVGQLPFNFQVGDDVKKIPLYPPQTPAGELEVRMDTCAGERIAVLPLAPASASNGVTVLSRVPIAKPERGPALASAPAVAQDATAAGENIHDLCLRFTRRGVDPIWAIDSIQLFE